MGLSLRTTDVVRREPTDIAEMVVQMRSEYVVGHFGYSKIANKYGISKRQAGNIILRKSWRHIL